MLLLFPIGTLVPSFMGSAPAALQQDAPEPVNEGIGEAEQSDVELNMMYFTPSASIEHGVYYIARRGADPVAYFGESQVYYVVGDTLLRLEFPGSMRAFPVGEEPTGSVTSYMYGNDSGTWKTGLKDCAVLKYETIYPGIDLVYRIVNGNLKYEFMVAPYADPSVIRLSYPDADRVEILDDRVTVTEDGFSVVDSGLWAFQKGAAAVDVDCLFRYHDTGTTAFAVGDYDTSQELVIDPTVLVVYGTFLGGTSSEYGYGIVIDNGSVFVTGYTLSSDFPAVDAYDTTLNGSSDCFVTKFSRDGQSLIYSTYFGGTGNDFAFALAVEGGCAYVFGYTRSSDFPTVNAYDSTFNGGSEDCFVTKLAPDGQSLNYSTYLGGTSSDDGKGIAVENGYAYVTGRTVSSDFPAVNGYDLSMSGSSDCFVTKLSVNGSYLFYSTFLGGTSNEQGYGIAVEAGCPYVTGYTQSSDFPTAVAYDSTSNGGNDCFLTKFSADGLSLVYSTYLGGASTDFAHAIAVEDGYAYVTGRTMSSDFPTLNAIDSAYNGNYDCYVIKFAIAGSSLIYSTFLGGASEDNGYGVAVEDGHAYVAGQTWSLGFPTADAYDPTYNGGDTDCFVAELAADGQSLDYSTFLGGNSNDGANGIAVMSGCAFVVGTALSANFPTADPYDSTRDGGMDSFIVILGFDTDFDGLSDWEESAIYGTSPLSIDSDNDNFMDGYEVAYDSDPMDPMSYPGIPQSWYDAIYEDLDGNATLIEQVISWLDGNHTAIEALFFYLDGNATLLIQTVNAVNSNSTQLDLLAALATQDVAALSSFNATYIGDMAQVRAVLDALGVTVGDSDCDGLDDLDEIALGTDILCIDTDCDNLNDAYEVKIGTDPTDDDSDNDTYYDGAEVLAGTDPLDALDYPGSASTTTTTTQPPMGTEFIIIIGAAGCVGLVALLVLMRRRAGAR